MTERFSLRGIGGFERDGADVDAVDGGSGRKAGGEVMHYSRMCHSKIREQCGEMRQAREPCDHGPERRARCVCGGGGHVLRHMMEAIVNPSDPVNAWSLGGGTVGNSGVLIW